MVHYLNFNTFTNAKYNEQNNEHVLVDNKQSNKKLNNQNIKYNILNNTLVETL